VHVGTGSWSRKATAEPDASTPPAPSRGAASARGARGGKRQKDGKAASTQAKPGPPGPAGTAQVKREERERRQSARRRARRRRFIAVAVIVGALVAGAVVLYESQAFEIESVNVVGTAELTEATVLERAAVPPGTTLLRVPASAIEARLLADPWIGEVVISRDFPSTLRIRIRERTPAALVDTGDAFWMVDSSGLVLAQESLETTRPLVAVRDVPGFEPRLGKTSNSDALVNALRVLGGISPELKSTVRAISAPSVDETTLITVNGVEIMVGEAENLPEKSVLAQGILQEQGSGVVFIDVRSIERPVSRGLGD